MFETLLIPTAIPHRCSLSSFIGLHFNLFFFPSPSPTPPSSCQPPDPTLSAFIPCLVSGFQKPLIAFWSSPPAPPLCDSIFSKQSSAWPWFISQCFLLDTGAVADGEAHLSQEWPRLTVATLRLRWMSTVLTGSHLLQRCRIRFHRNV